LGLADLGAKAAGEKAMNQPDVRTQWQRGRLHSGDVGGRILFGQVREDAASELAILNELGPGKNVVCVASGGCTALSLLAARPEHLTVVDINQAQLQVVRLKQLALEKLAFQDLVPFLYHDAQPGIRKLKEYFSATEQDFWDKNQSFMHHGVHGCGVVDRWLLWLVELFFFLFGNKEQTRTMLNLTNLQEQSRFYRESWDRPAWRFGLRCALHPWVLRWVYDPQFLTKLPANFAEIMVARWAHVFTKLPTSTNPYLHQLFFPTASTKVLPPWLQESNLSVIHDNLFKMQCWEGDMLEWLKKQPRCSVDFFCFSNILEATDPHFGQELLQESARVAKPKARMVLRSIFPQPWSQHTWFPNNMWACDRRTSRIISYQERSPFCPEIAIFDRVP
jgi:S-adenosylmethionine-diacylglycerol 3-amino-3-carboxypropyl transferase